jgi:hypothetical protein
MVGFAVIDKVILAILVDNRNGVLQSLISVAIAAFQTASAWLYCKWHAADGLRYNRIGDCF